MKSMHEVGLHAFGDDDVNEERRLFYMAMTRAKDKLYISHAPKRTVYGKTCEQDKSRFLGMLPPELIDLYSIQEIMSSHLVVK